MLNQFQAHLKIVLAIALISISAFANAHRFHAGITDISMNAQTGNTEIIHTYMTHDIEAILEKLHNRQIDLDDSDDVALLQSYIESNFIISTKSKSKLPVKWVGMKVDSNYTKIYQEIEKQALPKQASIYQAVLTDLLSSQINTINISQKQGVKTFVFKRSKKQQTVN